MPSLRPRTMLSVLLALAAGAALRLWFVHAFPQIQGDSLLYADIGRNWLTHGVYGRSVSHAGGLPTVVPTLVRLPGYPGFLALCFAAFGKQNYQAILYLQVVIDLLSCLLIAGLVRRLCGDRAAWIALWLAVLCPFTANYVAMPLTEALSIFCVALGLYAFSAALAHPHWRWMLTLAFASSYAALLRPDGALLAVALFPALIFYGRAGLGWERWLRIASLWGLVALLPFVAWTARNWRTFHVFQPLAPRSATDPGEIKAPGFQRWTKTWMADFASTYEIYWNVPGDDIDLRALPARALDSPHDERATRALVAQYNADDVLTPQIDAGFAALAAARIRAHPVRYYVTLPLLRLADMWLRPRVEMLNIELRWWQYRLHHSETRISYAYGALNLAYLAAALIGAFYWPRFATAMVAYAVLRSMLLLTLEAPEPRYTLECFPIVIAFAAAALDHALGKPGDRGERVRQTVSGQKMAAAGLLFLIAILHPPTARAQQPFQTDSVAPERFIAAHGRKAIVMGYASSGLELWAYPIQTVSDYELGFRSGSDTTEISGSTLLRRVTYEPEAITRTYLGPDFIVRERLFVPLDEPAVLLTYTVESRHSVDIVIHFTPVLNLMWPMSLGGQSTRWDPAASAYILSEATHKYSAMIGSPDVVSHDQVLNSARSAAPGGRLAFALRAGAGSPHSVTVVVASTGTGSEIPAARIKQLLSAQPRFETEAQRHYAALLANTLRIETPNQEVNQQLAWAQIALDQAWVCNPILGCGLVAGYGPSRAARRPQFDWFFGGDGLIAIDALLGSEDYDRARDALNFIIHYQDANNGMIWHELSQSADPADWATRYPYMFAHVDITFQFLIMVERYVAASGDTPFIEQHWRQLEAAYRYCASVIDLEDGLPRIPASKEGADEQDVMADDLSLSVSWVEASAGFGRLAGLSGHAPEADGAARASAKARSAIVRRYWDDGRNTWIDGHNEAGRSIFRESDGGILLVADPTGPGRILDPRRSEVVLSRLAGAAFQTDWGSRGIAANSSQFDPAQYSRGTVSPMATGGIASALWSNHRPFVAFPIWSSLLPWGALDSMGHMHELLAGDFYHQQLESVPEQTWSSAAFLSSTVKGLLGLERESHDNRLAFSPHLPADWDQLSIRNLKVSGGNVAMTLARGPQGLNLETENSGSPIELLFSPEIPFGSRLRGAELDGKPVEARIEDNAEDTHATLHLKLPHGKSHCLIRYEGGVMLSVSGPAPLLGEPSKAIKLTSVTRKAATLVLDADILRNAPASTIELRTTEKPLKVQGATLKSISEDRYELLVDQPSSDGSPDTEYRRVTIVVDFTAGREK